MLKKLTYLSLLVSGISPSLYCVDGVTVTTDNTEVTIDGQLTTVAIGDDGVSNIGDNNKITNNGRIEIPATGDDGISNIGDKVTITNNGLISTGGSDSHGIFNSGGANSSIASNGHISVIGDVSFGIFDDSGSSSVITNRGKIVIVGEDSRGIASHLSDNVLITNNGQIFTDGDGSNGIVHLLGENIRITNNGKISSNGELGFGAFTFFDTDVFITNNGEILVTGLESIGVFNNFGTNVVIVNNGKISNEGSFNSYGILSTNSINTTVINSGQILSANSPAIELLGENPSLSLLLGSNIEGAVKVTNDLLNLSVQRGLNLALTLSSDSLGYGDIDIEAPFVQKGNLVSVIDITGFVMQPDMVEDLSDAILNNIFRYDRLFCCNYNPCCTEMWIQGIGSYRERDYGHNIFDYKNWQGGVLAGIDKTISAGNLGTFVGYSYGRAKVEDDSQIVKTNSYIAGLSYEYCHCNTFLGFALAAGYVDWCNTRYIMDNLANEGISIAEVDTGGGFVTPEAVIAHQFCFYKLSPVLSFTLRYAELFLGDYQEDQNVLGALSIKDRDIGLLDTRLELAIPLGKSCRSFCWNIKPYVGVWGRYQVDGCKLQTELLNQSLLFDQGGPRNLVAFLYGLNGVVTICSWNFFLNIEGSFDNGSSNRVLGEAGISVSF